MSYFSIPQEYDEIARQHGIQLTANKLQRFIDLKHKMPMRAKVHISQFYKIA